MLLTQLYIVYIPYVCTPLTGKRYTGEQWMDNVTAYITHDLYFSSL